MYRMFVNRKNFHKFFELLTFIKGLYLTCIWRHDEQYGENKYVY